MLRFFCILMSIIGIVGCQGIPPAYEMPNNWDKFSLSEKQAWLEGYYWGSRNYSMGWGTFPLGYSTYHHPGWGWQEPSYSNHHVVEEHETKPQEDKPSAPSIRSEPPNTLSSQSTHCSAENSCKQFRPR